jgi:anti-sigma factor RsiW
MRQSIDLPPRAAEALAAMDHHEAMRRAAVEKYLLDEMTDPERNEFEEHFFGCQECAADLSATAAMLDGAKREFKRGLVARPRPTVGKKTRFAFLWRPAFVSPALALLLLIIVYQNAVVYPRFAGEIAQNRNPEILSSVSLIGGNSRGAAIPSVTVAKAQPILLSVDIPMAERFSSYSCVLVAPSGAIVWRVPVSAEQAKDTVSIRVPAGTWERGDYALIVQGHTNLERAEPVALARYRFTLHSSN